MADEEKKEEKKVEEAQETTNAPAEEKTESFDKAQDTSAEAEVKAEDKPEETKDEAPVVESIDKAQDTSAESEKAKKEEKPSSAKATEDKPAPSGKFKDLIKEIESMTVSDLAKLVKALEDRFGVSAAMPMAVTGAAGAPAVGAEEAEEKSSYTVMLKDSGAQKIAVIKAVREINQDLGLKEAKDLVDGAPKEIKKDIPKADAEEAKKKLEAAGATAELV